MAELNACWNSAFRKSFGFHRWESVRQFIHGLGRLDLIHIFMLRKSKFMCKTYQGSNTLMYNLLWCYISSSGTDVMLCSFVFSGFYSAMKHIVHEFAASCDWFLHIPKLNTVDDNGRYAINTTCKVASDMCSVCCIFLVLILYISVLLSV